MQKSYSQGRYGVELKGKTWRFDGGIQIYGENLKEFHQKMTGGQNYTEYVQNDFANAFADLHREKIGRALNRCGR